MCSQQLFNRLQIQIINIKQFFFHEICFTFVLVVNLSLIFLLSFHKLMSYAIVKRTRKAPKIFACVDGAIKSTQILFHLLCCSPKNTSLRSFVMEIRLSIGKEAYLWHCFAIDDDFDASMCYPNVFDLIWI